MLQDLMQDAGFVIDSAAAAGSIETGQKSFNQWMSSKATKRDLVVSFRKPRPGEPRSVPAAVDLDGTARQVLREYLTAHGGATKDRLYDALVSHLVCLGQMQSFDFEALLRSVAEEDEAAARPGVSQVWRMKSEEKK
jgi:hypothetical protein